ncbi:pyridoxal phosphate-dependent aminotransferase [Desulfuromonas sp. KJ2020]|uniref:pyridoxal phosphate-dependent aminotransferase n=1 Tax=Desulfuromonas sp. KJ2020 TaxID=2919173 RepID=UPI0020A71430|nr:pyridoxal phosphate-dependent aminotransferase [Desulfuromonas sp. KJ2020]MCP3178017.1 pyridoxal phosphate-dependent aminotransferase [Desulfuromonas sp. KJ2020]
MSISVKVSSFIEKASWIRKMFEEGAMLRKIHGEENVFDFTLGNPCVEPPEAFREELLKLATNPIPGMHRYMNNAGYEETRAAVADVVSEKSPQQLTASHVVMTCGAGAALNVVLKTVLNPGDEVIVLAPFFVEYRFYIDNHGGTTREVQTLPDSFQLDLPAIEKAITEKTAAIIINSPNNPTGVIYPAEDLQRLGQLLARKEKELDRQIFLISDEPYARILYDDQQVPGIFHHVKNAVIVTSHSKDLALPGERIGYLAVNPAMDNLNVFIEGAVFCNRVLGFVNAPALVQRLVTPLQRESVDIKEYQAKRDLLYDNLTAMGFKMVKPGGAFYLFPRSPLPDDVEFVRLAQKHNILLVPGSGFGAPGFFRIAYCIDTAVIHRSLPAWEKLAQEVGL